MPFRIEYSPEAIDHLRLLLATERALIVQSVDEQLIHEPTRVTRNRKQLRTNDTATFELRVRHLRILYDVVAEDETVKIRAIARKVGNRFIIGDEEVSL